MALARLSMSIARPKFLSPINYVGPLRPLQAARENGVLGQVERGGFELQIKPRALMNCKQYLDAYPLQRRRAYIQLP